MREIINGKLYDTDLSKQVFQSNWSEDLSIYRTKNGNYFKLENDSLQSLCLELITEEEAIEIIKREDFDLAIEVFGIEEG